MKSDFTFFSVTCCCLHRETSSSHCAFSFWFISYIWVRLQQQCSCRRTDTLISGALGFIGWVHVRIWVNIHTNANNTYFSIIFSRFLFLTSCVAWKRPRWRSGRTIVGETRIVDAYRTRAFQGSFHLRTNFKAHVGLKKKSVLHSLQLSTLFPVNIVSLGIKFPRQMLRNASRATGRKTRWSLRIKRNVLWAHVGEPGSQAAAQNKQLLTSCFQLLQPTSTPLTNQLTPTTHRIIPHFTYQCFWLDQRNCPSADRKFLCRGR